MAQKNHEQKENVGDGKTFVQPKVTVIIPAYNCSEFIAETLDSVFAQTFKDFEVLIVNDGSKDTDQLEEVLESFSGKINYFKQENKGIALARNLAISNARGEFLAFVDSDDLWLPNYLEKQVSEIERRNCDMIYTDAFLFGEGVKKGSKYSDSAPSSGEFTTESFIGADCHPIISGTVVSRQKVIERGMFDKDVPWMGMEDFDLWFRLVKTGAKIEYQTEPLIKYRVRSESVSGDKFEILERDLVGIEHLEQRYDLTEAEKIAAEKRKQFVRAHIDLEKAKLGMINQEFSSAIKYLKSANRNLDNVKIKAAIVMLQISPNLLLNALKIVQPHEYGTFQTNRK